MGIKVAFIGDSNVVCKGRGTEFTGQFLRTREVYWNQFKQVTGLPLMLSTVMEDLDYDIGELGKVNPELANDIMKGYWTADADDPVDFGMTFDRDGHFLLNFNCRMKEENKPKSVKKKRCYFWKVYKYHVSIDQITLKGWIEWCNELFEIQHGKKRPNDRIFINSDMTTATVKGRVWNKDKIEEWLNRHGYRWTQTVETKYQYPIVNDRDQIILIDSDEEIMNRKETA